MNQLTTQIIQKALQAPNPGRGSDLFFGLVCRWVALVDLKVALLYLKDSMDKARQTKNSLSINVTAWEELENWPELKQRSRLITWMTLVILENGSNAAKSGHYSREYFAENDLNNNLNLPSELELAKQLAALSPDEVESIMTKAAIEWALALDIEILKAHAMSNHYNYPDPSKLVSYPFALIYLTAEVAFHVPLWEDLLESWRK